MSEYIANLNLIGKEMLILSILILVGSLAQIKYMIDYNRNILIKDKYPIVTMLMYIFLIISHSFVALIFFNEYTLEYYYIVEEINKSTSIIIILLSIYAIKKNWLDYNNKKEQIIIVIFMILFHPIGMFLSIITPLISLIIIPCKYLNKK